MKMTGSSSCALDSNILIDLFRGRKEIADKIDQYKTVFVPIPVLGELYLGAESSVRRGHHLDQIDAVIKRSVILQTTNNTASIYGRLKSKLKRRGTPIPENDIWIAALVIEHDTTLVTRDSHFTHLPELIITFW